MRKNYQVSYYLGNIYHVYIVEAPNEWCAIQKVIDGISYSSLELFHDFKIERYFQEW